MTLILFRRTISVEGRENDSASSGASRSWEIALKNAGRQSQGGGSFFAKRTEGSKLKSPPGKPPGHSIAVEEESEEVVDFGVWKPVNAGGKTEDSKPPYPPPTLCHRIGNRQSFRKSISTAKQECKITHAEYQVLGVQDPLGRSSRSRRCLSLRTGPRDLEKAVRQQCCPRHRFRCKFLCRRKRVFGVAVGQKAEEDLFF